MLFAIGLVSTFITGGLTGIILGDSALDINLHDTYFVVAHFHLVMGISALYGLFAGVYHWYPRMFGLSYSRFMGGLKKADIRINRKMLAQLAVADPQTFTTITVNSKV